MRTRLMRTVLLLSQVLAVHAWAGFDEGIAAYTRRDYATAVRGLLPLAQQGNARAQYNLGVMYHYGQGVPQDYTQALIWCRRAADQGHVGAQVYLGVRYHNGQGVPQDYAEAMQWYRRAADHGHVEAKRNLGVMYRK